MTQNFAKNVHWDLSDLYTGIEDTCISQDMALGKQKAIDFESKYKPIFSQPEKLTADTLAALIAEYKEIMILLTKPGVFSHLSFATKTNDATTGAFMQKIQVELTEIQTHLLFFDVCWNRVDEAIAQKLVADPKLSADAHFLKKTRLFSKHTLTEPEEKIMALKSNTGISAFRRLFDEILNNIAFYIQINGQSVKKTESEVLSLLHSPERSERKMASDSLSQGLTENTHVLSYMYNQVLADHRLNMQIRSLKHPMDSMNFSNEISLSSVLNLVDSVKTAYPIAQRYYRLKKQLMGLDVFYDYDRYAPITSDETKIDFEECKNIVLEGYYGFSEETGKIAQQFFDKKWIDAEVRPGKRGGGFCCETTPSLHPYILVNYTGSLRDVMTVAHELGHGIHQFLARKAGILESGAPLTMAETASVFGEMIVFEKILEKEKDSVKRMALLCGKIDDNFATVYRQIAMTDFELQAHTAGIAEGELSAERLSEFWMKANTDFYGQSVTLTENYRHGWKYIPHFIHSPFYCYAYSFAQLFVLCLFQKYKQTGKAFIPTYFEMLTLGGSKEPKEIAKLAGFDIEDKNFWKLGIDILDNLVKQAESNTKK